MAATIDHNAAAGSVVIMEKTDKRDYLIDIEKKYRAAWQESKIFEANAPELPAGVDSFASFFESNQSMKDVQTKNPKWFGTFPYAYMNGTFHLGHAFTISKIEFAAGFERMRGKTVLFPVGYHVTGMPIKASADKLVREMEMFGQDFSGFDESQDTKPEAKSAPAAKALEDKDPSKAKKGKLSAKSTGLTYQFQIMQLLGIPKDEIKLFADPQHWLHFFPPLARRDLSDFGGRIDWRRQFLTTDANPYYDSFVRWQMNKLRRQGKIKFGERYTIYSPKDGQPCMDHDRQSGEAVNPQEYTAVKLQILEWGNLVPEAVQEAVKGRRVYAVAATLRPETMYGQTNCFVGTAITYEFFEAVNGDIYLVTHRAARNMAYQSIVKQVEGSVKAIAEVSGADLLGSKVKPPFGLAPEVYILPMDGVLSTKGTGVVTSVPSDSPDDWRTLMDLRKKPEMFKIQKEWASVDPIPVLSTPKYGDMAAETICTQLKIQSQKDKALLADAKDLAYKEGFYNGTMLVGDFKGLSVADAKPKVRQQMIDQDLAFAYAEPESEVISRSADVCVVALVDQWYLDYGEEEWKAVAKRLLEGLNTYAPETRNAFEGVLDWLNQWACARSFGLGSKLPWDPQFLVESLSDSTIYMSYYTVAHLLHEELWGRKPGRLGITASDMTDEAWEYVLGDGPIPSVSADNKERLSELKYNFQYFYPLDIRSSGKDLIPNHLTFWIYVHAALFPEHHWPRSVRANGHLMLNGKKMSKSTGNFLTLNEAIAKYGADAARLSLADAGEDISDANLEETVANAAILRLHTACQWALEMRQSQPNLRDGPLNEYDLGLRAEMDALIQRAYNAYDRMEFKTALKMGLYDFENARNWYRIVTAPENGGPGMHRDLVFDWIKTNALLIAPFTPHFSEFIWKEILHQPSSVQSARFPEPSGPIDSSMLRQVDYMRGAVDSLRSAEALVSRRKAGKGQTEKAFDPSKPKAVRIYVTKSFPAWQEECVAIVKGAWNAESRTIDEARLRKEMDAAGLTKNKKAMPFSQTFKRKVLADGAVAFDRAPPFSEVHALKLVASYIKSSLKYQDVSIVSIDDGLLPEWNTDKAETSEPGTPGVEFWNV